MKEYKTTKSEVAKHILIKSCYKIVLGIARRFYSFNPDVDFMDLVQYGFLGLLDALEKFDMSYEKQRLAFFAERFIRLYISNGLCNLKANITYPQHYYETNYFLNIFFEKFYKENNRFPKQIEILDELNWKMYTNIKLETVRYILDLYKTEFISIEESEEQGLLYSIVDTTEIDSEAVTAIVNDVEMSENTDFVVDRVAGKVTFTETPSEPNLSGQDNVFITFSKTVEGYADRINKCTQALLFDNRLFFTGNPDYPNAVFHAELNNPQYISDLNYYEDGAGDSQITGMTVGNNILWVFKNLDQNNANVFYHEPTLDTEAGKIYPSKQGNVSIGCYAGSTNFQDDIVYLSRYGLEGVTTEKIDSRQVVAHRSTLVDVKMTNEGGYQNACMVIWKGYLCILVNGRIYLADSRQKYASLNSFEYEWYYWDISNANPNILKEYDDELYIGAKDGSIFIVEGTNDNGETILSYWTTPMDNFGYDNQLKTTNKRGGITKIKTIQNGRVKIARRTDKSEDYKYTTEKSATGFSFNNISFANFSFVTTNKSYVLYKIKEKKINELSLKFYSDEKDKPFGIYSATIEAFIGGYIKK